MQPQLSVPGNFLGRASRGSSGSLGAIDRWLRRVGRAEAGWRLRLSQTIRTAPPVGDLSLVYLVAPVVARRETRGGTDRAVDIDQTPADTTDQMVVVVADTVLEASR